MTLPIPRPAINPDTSHFWAETAASRLVLQRCSSCSSVVWYPRPICPVCWSRGLEWFEAVGSGVIYSYTVVRRAPGGYSEATPYILAYVELDEGPRLLTNIVDSTEETLEIGAKVHVVFDRGDDDFALVRFRPA